MIVSTCSGSSISSILAGITCILSDSPLAFTKRYKILQHHKLCDLECLREETFRQAGMW